MLVESSPLANYTPYDWVWAVPIAFPISIGLVVQASVYIDHFTRMQRKPSVLVHMLMETAFGISVLVQSIANFASNGFAGGRTACIVQGWIVTFYVFASLNMYVLCYMRLPRTRFLTGCVIGGAVLVSSFPLMGVGDYYFATDFCIPSPGSFGVAIILDYTVALFTLMATFFFVLDRNRLCGNGLIIDYAALAYAPLVVISAMTLAGTNPVVTHPGLYALAALALTANQIVVPIIFGWYWVNTSEAEDDTAAVVTSATQRGLPIANIVRDAVTATAVRVATALRMDTPVEETPRVVRTNVAALERMRHMSQRA